MEFLPRLIGTLQDYLRIGLAGIRIVNNSGMAQIKNAGGTAFVNLGAHTLEVQGSNASNKVSLTAPAGLGGNVALTLPATAGGAGEVLVSDGSGNLSFTAPISNGVMCQVEAFTEATSSPVAIFTPPANSTIFCWEIEITAAASAGSPTVSVGTVADPDLDMDELESDLKTAGSYKIYPNTSAGGSPVARILTITPDSQSFTGLVRCWYGAPA